MIETAEAEPASRLRRLSASRRAWIVLILAALVIAVGGVSGVVVSFHYLHAPALIVNGGRWLSPDKNRFGSINEDQTQAVITAPRLGQTQTFTVDLDNPSSVSQSVLGLTNAKTLGDPTMSGEPEHISVSTTSISGNNTLKYTTKPVVIPPHATYSLRVAYRTGEKLIWGTTPCDRSEFWTSVSLRVQVGAFTRTETVNFEGMVIELVGPGSNCKAMDTGQ